MAISSISDIYNKYISSITNNTAKVADNSSSISQSNTKDTVQLNSSKPDLSGFLNYGANGMYNMPSLADYLNTDSDNQDDLMSILGNNNNSDSTDSSYGLDSQSTDLIDSLSGLNNESDSNPFQNLIEENTKKVNDLIEKAMEKLKAQKSE